MVFKRIDLFGYDSFILTTTENNYASLDLLEYMVMPIKELELRIMRSVRRILSVDDNHLINDYLYEGKSTIYLLRLRKVKGIF